MLITVLITSLGSNNAVYSSINNLFLVMPWFIGTSWKFFKEKKSVWYFPFQCLITAVLVLLFIQSVRFGTTFVYEEADGGRKLDTVIEEVPVLAGMKTNARKAAALTGLYGHLQENNLLQHECLLYGRIPGVAYYMDMAPAMNIWADLDSYTYQTMEKDLIQLGEEIQSGGQKPVMILEAGVYTDIQEQLTKEVSFLEGKTDDKTRLICEWIKEFGYTNTYINEKFAVFQ